MKKLIPEILKNSLYPRLFSGLILISLLCCGCDNNLELLDEETGSYSIYGALDMSKEINFIRVKDLKVPIQDLAETPLDVEVKLENVTDGISQILKDSIVVFEGVPTHNFYTTLDIPPRTEFRVTVTGPNGRIASAMAMSPNISDVHVSPEEPGCRTLTEVEISPVEIGNVSSQIAFDYEETEWRWGGFEHEFEDLVVHTFYPQDIMDEIWKDLAVDSFDCYVLCYEDPRPQCYQLDSDFWRVKYTHYGPSFNLEASEDVNIPGGIGTFGILRTVEKSFKIDSSRVIPPRPLPRLFCPNGCPPM